MSSKVQAMLIVAVAFLALSASRCQGSPPPADGAPDVADATVDETPPPAKTSPAPPEPREPARYDPRQSLAPLVEKVQGSVVNIYTSKVAPRYNPLAPFFFPGQPQLEEQRALGSGFLYDQTAGLVVTNHHVIAKTSQVRVRLQDRRELTARVLGSDRATDIALLQVQPAEQLEQVELGDSDNLRVGDWVVAIGNPFGLSQTVTVGIVSALSRTIGAGPYDDFIQTDASINPGNSGGPLFDMNGRVVGINTAIHAEGHGIGFAIPISMARPLLDQIRSSGRVVRSHLGVVIQDVTPDLAQAMGLERPAGALVATVMADSPAARSGIQPGDVIVEFNGHQIEVSRNLPTQVARTPVGEAVEVVVIRSGERRAMQATLDERQAPPTPPGFGQPGFGHPGQPGFPPGYGPPGGPRPPGGLGRPGPMVPGPGVPPGGSPFPPYRR